jgi:HK97 family phage portal protein
MVGFFNAIGRGIEHKSTDISALTWSRLWGEGGQVKSGVAVNVDAAMRNATGFACGRVISEDVGSLPFKLYQARKDRGADIASEHPLYRLIYEQPNAWMTSMEFIELLTLHAVMTGNGYAFKNMDSGGRVLELLPLLPNVKVHQDSDWRITYEVPQLGGERFEANRIFHLRGPGWNGVSGFDVVQVAREAFGLAIATEETHARLHKNSAKPSGLFSVDGTLSQPSYDRIKAQIEQSRSGLENAHKTWILDQAAKWTPMVMTGVDSQHLETRRFQLEELCRFFRVIPQMVMHSDKSATFAASESHFIAHVVHTIRPWARRWELTVKRDLLSGKGDERVFAKVNLSALMRGDSKSRAEYFKAALGAGGSDAWMTPNEVRELDELNPLDGADELAKAVKPMAPGDGAVPFGAKGEHKGGFDPLQERDDHGRWSLGISGGGDGAGDGSGSSKPRTPEAHLSAISAAAETAARAMQANTYDAGVHRAAFQAELDALMHDKTVANSKLREIAETLDFGPRPALGKTRQELIDEIGRAFTQHMRFIDKTRPSKGS